MDQSTERAVTIDRVGKATFRATNAEGVTLTVGEAGHGHFTPVELLLTALAACSAIDVDYIVSKRAEPARLAVRARGDKLRDERGNHLADVSLTFDVAFPEGEEGDAARAVLPRAMAQSHDRLCTVTRTVEIGTPVGFRLSEA